MLQQDKLKKALEALKKIAEHSGEGRRDDEGYLDEWNEADAFHGVRDTARDALKEIGVEFWTA